mmetsp:Transcript_22393/g.25694  ORF Transcript_22393/g.25694 Transcript_22393/m.25694 type:complete len:243 (-) Transcript_22393:317-1045(-)
MKRMMAPSRRAYNNKRWFTTTTSSSSSSGRNSVRRTLHAVALYCAVVASLFLLFNNDVRVHAWTGNKGGYDAANNNNRNTNKNEETRKKSVVPQFQLTPHTLPRDNIERQLTALQMEDMAEAYRLTSPENQERTGNAINFGHMARAFPYSPLIRHEQAQILMESRTVDDESLQFLVRVVSSSSQVLEDEERSSSSSSRKISEYWWSLSRSKMEDDNDDDDELEDDDSAVVGSYMVDAIFPNN